MKQSIQYHTDKATLILDNTASLYERKIAIFKVVMKCKDYVDFHRTLRDLARETVAKTNLSETADEFMKGKVFDKVADNVYQYLLDDYQEFQQEVKKGYWAKI